MKIKQLNYPDKIKNKFITRKLLSWICFAGSVICGLSLFTSAAWETSVQGLILFVNLVSSVFILGGLGLIFDQNSRKVMEKYLLSENNAHASNELKNKTGDAQISKIKANKKSAKYLNVLNEDIDPSLTIVNEGNAYVKEIEKAYDHIVNDGVKSDLLEIKANITDIFDAASKDKAVEKQIRKVNAYYLPTLIVLLNTYIHLSTRKVQTKAAQKLKCDIEESIGQTKTAFCKLNEDLAQSASMDAQAEIETLQNVLEIDGLLNEHSLQMPSEEKEEV